MTKARGCWIALYGPDGCGKSTVADALQSLFEQQGAAVVRMHWRPGVLPYRRDLSSRKEVADFSAPHATPVRKGWKAWLLFGYIWADFILGYWWKVRSHLFRGCVVLHERYYFDLLADHRRYGLQLPERLLTWAGKLVPSPRISVLLDARTAVIFERKRELSPAEINAQRKRLTAALQGYPGFLVVDTERHSPQACALIIRDFCRGRTRA